MTRIITILFFFSITLISNGQELITSTQANCNDSLYMSLKGRWKKSTDVGISSKFPAALQKEAFNRLDTIHKLLLQAYPEPTGLDAKWHRVYMNSAVFGYKVTYSGENANYDISVGTPVGRYSYTCGFFRYYCFNDAVKKEVRSDGETGTWFMIRTNELWGMTESIGNDTMTIEGRPVLFRSPVKEIWKGYPVFGTGETGSTVRRLLLHRKGILPYIPVTRRQYLEHCLNHIPAFFEPALSDSLIEKEQKELIEQQKKNALKRFGDAWNQSDRDKLLDSAAYVLEMHPLVETEGLPIFTTEVEGGRMLVTENPLYWRKDLPIYMPQIFIMHWQWNEGHAATDNFRNRLEKYFPIEKLQAMIDK